MSEHIEFEQGKMIVDVARVLELLDDEHRRILAKMLAFDAELMDGICDMVVKGEAYEDEGGWWIGGSDFAPSMRNLACRLRMQLVPLMDDKPAAKLIEALLSDMKKHDADRARAEKWAWQMYHAWPSDAGRQNIPMQDKFTVTDGISNAHARAVLGIFTQEPPEERGVYWRRIHYPALIAQGIPIGPEIVRVWGMPNGRGPFYVHDGPTDCRGDKPKDIPVDEHPDYYECPVEWCGPLPEPPPLVVEQDIEHDSGGDDDTPE